MKNYSSRFLSILILMTLFSTRVTPDDTIPVIQPAGSQRQTLKILTWNIYMLPFCSPVNGNNRRARGIAQELSKSDFDILVFEEAFDFGARKILRAKLVNTFPYIYGPANDSYWPFRTNSGLWILSKIPLHQLEAIEFESRSGIDAMARKGAVLFEGEWQGQNFQLLGTHLQADSPDNIRRRQCEEIAGKLLKKYARNEVPQIVCGDFNIDNDDPDNYHFMLTTLDARNGSLEGNLQSSYDEIDNDLAKCENGKKRLIDYVLLRNASCIQDIQRKVIALKQYKNNILSNLSDHYGIEAVIHFDQPGNATLSLLHR